MAELILVRHGQSEWNLQNRFTGWKDVELTDLGIQEAHGAASKIKKDKIDIAFTSDLKRAQHTLDIILKDDHWQIPVEKNQALNERSYGSLEGLNKAETAEKYGAEQVHLWRRSFDVVPPNGESLKNTYDRVLPYFHAHILPLLAEGKNVLIVAHGNSLRSLMMYLEKLSPEKVVSLELATGIPIVYQLDSETLQHMMKSEDFVAQHPVSEIFTIVEFDQKIEISDISYAKSAILLSVFR